MTGTTFEVFDVIFFSPRSSLRSFAGFLTPPMNTDFYQSPAKSDIDHMTATAHEGQGEDRRREAAFEDRGHLL